MIEILKKRRWIQTTLTPKEIVWLSIANFGLTFIVSGLATLVTGSPLVGGGIGVIVAVVFALPGVVLFAAWKVYRAESEAAE